MCITAQFRYDCCCYQHRGLQWRRTQITTYLLQHQPQAGVAIAQAAVCFINCNAGPAHFRHLGPDRIFKSSLAAAIAQRAQMPYRCMLTEETRGGITKHYLLFI